MAEEKSYAMFLKDGAGFRQFGILGEKSATECVKADAPGTVITKEMTTNAYGPMRLPVSKSYVYGRGPYGTYQKNDYRTEGPDGTQFQNSDLQEMRRVIARKYAVRINQVHFVVTNKK